MLQSDPFGHMTLRDITLEASSAHMLKKLLIRAAKEAKALWLQGAAFQSEVLLGGRTFSSAFLQGVVLCVCACAYDMFKTLCHHFYIIMSHENAGN